MQNWAYSAVAKKSPIEAMRPQVFTPIRPHRRHGVRAYAKQ